MDNKHEALIAWLRAVAPYRKPGCSYGPAFNMDGFCLNDLNAKINEAATALEAANARVAVLERGLERIERDGRRQEHRTMCDAAYQLGDIARATLGDQTT